jgi:hypothetical protein
MVFISYWGCQQRHLEIGLLGETKFLYGFIDKNLADDLQAIQHILIQVHRCQSFIASEESID